MILPKFAVLLMSRTGFRKIGVVEEIEEIRPELQGLFT
jgi:hypothetical protein